MSTGWAHWMGLFYDLGPILRALSKNETCPPRRFGLDLSLVSLILVQWSQTSSWNWFAGFQWFSMVFNGFQWFSMVFDVFMVGCHWPSPKKIVWQQVWFSSKLKFRVVKDEIQGNTRGETSFELSRLDLTWQFVLRLFFGNSKLQEFTRSLKANFEKAQTHPVWRMFQLVRSSKAWHEGMKSRKVRDKMMYDSWSQLNSMAFSCCICAHCKVHDFVGDVCVCVPSLWQAEGGKPEPGNMFGIYCFPLFPVQPPTCETRVGG